MRYCVECGRKRPDYRRRLDEESEFSRQYALTVFLEGLVRGTIGFRRAGILGIRFTVFGLPCVPDARIRTFIPIIGMGEGVSRSVIVGSLLSCLLPTCRLVPVLSIRWTAGQTEMVTMNRATCDGRQRRNSSQPLFIRKGEISNERRAN
jgi:hypothetical protein